MHQINKSNSYTCISGLWLTLFQTLAKVYQILVNHFKTSNYYALLGIDYTLSNNTNGYKTFEGQSLHTLHPSSVNPYQKVG